MQFGSVYWFLYPWTHFKVNFLLSKQQKGSLSKPETSIARKSRGGGGKRSSEKIQTYLMTSYICTMYIHICIIVYTL